MTSLNAILPFLLEVVVGAEVYGGGVEEVFFLSTFSVLIAVPRPSEHVC